jgi:hypothetical protein
MWNWEGGLRPVGAIGAYAPEGRWKKRSWEDEKVCKKTREGDGESERGGG